MRKGFTLIEVLVVIAIVAIIMGILLPAMTKARIAGQLAVSQSNMRQFGAAHENYRTDFRGQLPIPLVFANYSNPAAGFAGSASMLGGGFCRSFWSGSSLDFWPGERMLNPYTNPNDALPHPRDVNPNWTIAMLRPDPGDEVRQRSRFANWRSPRDKTSWLTRTGTADRTISGYDDRGTSYLANILWLEHASYVMTGDPFSEIGLQRAVRWGNNAYNQIETHKFVVAFDQITAAVYSAPVVGGQRRATPGEYGGTDKSVMGFADGHADYVQM